jgi:NAD(P)H-dependent flavin oxidoreductase YrpB (nitropropane dioxygenase family)
MLTGKPVRTIGTPTLREYEAARLNGADKQELDLLRKRYRQHAREHKEFAAVAGQISGLVHEISNVVDIFTHIIDDAARLLETLERLKATGNVIAHETTS